MALEMKRGTATRVMRGTGGTAAGPGDILSAWEIDPTVRRNGINGHNGSGSACGRSKSRPVSSSRTRT